MHRSVKGNTLIRLNAMLLLKSEREKRYRKRDLPALNLLFNGISLMAGLNEGLCKHLHMVHHPPVALQRLIVPSLSYRLLFQWCEIERTLEKGESKELRSGALGTAKLPIKDVKGYASYSGSLFWHSGKKVKNSDNVCNVENDK